MGVNMWIWHWSVWNRLSKDYHFDGWYYRIGPLTYIRPWYK